MPACLHTCTPRLVAAKVDLALRVAMLEAARSAIRATAFTRPRRLSHSQRKEEGAVDFEVSPVSIS